MPFLRRKPETEPGAPVPEANPAAPASAEAAPAPAPGVPPLSEPLQTPETATESPVESQFQPVEGADEMLDMPLGTLIFRAGLIAPQQLEDALAEGLRSGKRLGEVLLARGWLSEEDLSRLLAGQKGLPYADLEKIAIDRELAQAMSYEDARTEMALPVVAEFGVPVIAMADPDEAAMDRLRAQLGSEVRFVVGAPSVLTRLIDEVLGGAPAPGLLVAPTADVQSEPVEPSAAESYAPDEPPPAEPVQPETVAEPEPVALDSSDQETPAPDPDFAAQEIRPIIAEGEVDYPTFSELESIPEAEIINPSGEQLPAEVQTGEYGYFDDPTLLEGNAWQPGETGPPAVELEAEATDLSAGQYDAEAQVENVEQPAEEAEAPVEVAEAQVENVEQPAEEAWEEPASEPVSEPITSDTEEPAPEQPLEPAEEIAVAPSGEEDLSLTTPAWMRGEVNVITADVADFIDSGTSTPSESPAPPPAENHEVDGDESEPVAGEDETPVEAAPLVDDVPEADPAEPETPELAQSEPAATELGTEAPAWAGGTGEPAAYESDHGEPAAAEVDAEADAEPPAWSSEPSEATEDDVVETTGELVPEAVAASEEKLAPEPSQGKYELILRLADGDRMPIGSFETVEAAQEKAAEVFKQFAETKEGAWPLIGGRFLRPETIVSIDVEQHGSGWGGSNARGRMFSGNENE